MFNFSLGSKELFHSNFLAWLGENQATRHVFLELINLILRKKGFENRVNWIDEFKNKSDLYIFRREYKHFDLCILHKKGKSGIPVFILENKVKSIPTFEQLNKYSQKITEYRKRSKWNTDKTTCVLLTLIEDFQDRHIVEESKWIVVTYNELAECLNQIHFNQNSYLHYLIDDYRLFINLLCELKNTYTTSDKYLLESKVANQLSEIRIVDLAQKLKTSKLCDELQKQLKAKIANREKDHQLYWILIQSHKIMKIGVGYSNKSALLDVVIYLDDCNICDILKKKDNINTLHIQIQGNQYRHAYEFEINNEQLKEFNSNKARSEQYRSIVKTIADKQVKQFDQNLNNTTNNLECWLNHSSKMNGSVLESAAISADYNSFKASKDGRHSLFVYKYLKINKETTITSLAQFIVEDLQGLQLSLLAS